MNILWQDNFENCQVVGSWKQMLFDRHHEVIVKPKSTETLNTKHEGFSRKHLLKRDINVLSNLERRSWNKIFLDATFVWYDKENHTLCLHSLEEKASEQ